ncbi:hypothetical protein F7Q99_13155 [Streptomyces kaniharaensis]|uniref:Toxin-antitoxin system, toxin component n=1 Tax=Streptomyces kaniharaensis TaxID=212423 RepID=A0A6N7KT66_9ACTN|nr:hypothetical protein [Streptomyces kaniharaensis]MQS13204.1 hypothetical protein [Streptomyces kaniharaensis]
MPYGAPQPHDANPYAAGNPYGQPAPPPPPGYGYPAPPPPDPAYGYPQQAPGYGYPAAAAQGGPVCRVCGGFPAVQTTVRGHQGIIVIMRFLKQHGPFCRVCGDATVRNMSARTLVQGWWSYLGSVFTLVTLLLNLGAHNKIKQLPPPAPGTHGPQLDPGVPLARRPHIFMLLLPAGWIITVIALIATGALFPKNPDPIYPAIPTVSIPAIPSPSFSPKPLTSPTYTLPPVATPTLPKPSDPGSGPEAIDSAKAGDCLRNENGTGATNDTNPRITMLPCTDSRAQYKVIWKYLATSDEKVCEQQPKSDSTYYRKYTGMPALSYVLCLQSIHTAGTS